MKSLPKSAPIVIVGSGAGGGSAAWRLAVGGYKVLVLEAGPSFNADLDYKQNQAEWETPFPSKEGSLSPYTVAPLQKLTPKINDIRSWSKVNGPYVRGNERANFGYHHVRGIGGSSLSFTGEAHRINPQSMSMRTRFGVASDWPVSYDELEPYWTEAENLVGVAGSNSHPYCWRSSSYPLPAHRYSYASNVLALGAKKAGLNPTPNSLAVLSQPFEDRPSCNYCGGCQRGCQLADKGSIDVTYLRHAESTGKCDVISDTEVLKLLHKNDKVTGLLVSHKGRLEQISSEFVILAAGAIQTPRILLNSSTNDAPDGLANESGQVGRNLMETLLTTSTGLHPDQLGSHRGLPVNWVAWDFNAPDAIEGVIGGARFGPAMAESDLVGPIAYATRVVGGWGISHRKAMENTFGKVLSIAGIGESLPNDKTYVELGSEKDKYGLPVANIHSYLDDMAHERLRFMMKICRGIIDESGCNETIEEFSSADAFSSTHVFGTCRMGKDPETSVVDEFGRSHRWRNLLVADGSIFPSSGGGESPGLTIQALALRSVDALIREGI